MQFSVVEYYGKQNSSHCGYCKQVKSSHSHGMHAYIMVPQDYQDLIDRGWRRSGHYCYKPNNKITCCPLYTIKCDTTNFKLSKSHKKILKRMNKFLRDGIKDKDKEQNDAKAEAETHDHEGGGGCAPRDETEIPNIPVREIELDKISQVTTATVACPAIDQSCEDTTSAQPTVAVSKVPEIDESKPPRKKAKQMRLERKQAKLLAKGVPLDSISISSNSKKCQTSKEKSLRDFINDVTETDRHKLKIKLVEVKSDEFMSTMKESFALYSKYQTVIHNDPPEGLSEYLSFLQKSPIKRVKTVDGPPEGYGSFHQQYWLDDKLIAVGVIDILPYCVSSVYFFYDPDYSFLSLGTYGSLIEIDFVHQLYESTPALKYYYMGFYIHSCPKMRYKGKLVPSYLLCPETYDWHEITDEIRSQLDVTKYKRLNSDPAVSDPEDFTEADLDSVLLLVEGNSFTTYRQYIQITGEDGQRNSIIEYGKLVGKTCAHRMLYVAA